MADALKRLSGPTALTNAAATQYTVPALTSTVLRSIHVNNETSNARTFTLSVGADGAGKRLFGPGLSIPGNAQLDWSGNIALAAGELVQAYSDVGAALTLTLSGVETS